MGLLAVLICAGAVATWVMLMDQRTFPSYGPSMNPTLKGPRPLDINFDAYEDQAPAIGDVVLALTPVKLPDCLPGDPAYSSCEPRYIDVVKRVVAGPGDEIAFTASGRAVLNGARVEEPFIRPCTYCPEEVVTVPGGHYFLAGDNRANSSDSREWGTVALADIEGRVELP